MSLSNSSTSGTTNKVALRLWEKPSASNEKEWLSKHPVQPSSNLEFNVNKVFKQSVGAEEIKREWISHNSCTKKLHCYICLAYSSDRNSLFVNGIDTADIKHLYYRIHEHEKSKTHDTSVCSYMMAKKTLNLPSYFSITASRLHDNAVLKNQHIIYCVIKAIVFLVKKGLHLFGELATMRQHTI